MFDKNHKKSKSIIHEYSGYQNLKLELKNLEKWCAELTIEKTECESIINTFNNKYLLCFGELIKEILELRASIFGKRKQYEEQNKVFKILGNLYESLEGLPEEFDDLEVQELKIAYRKACRLCHPDKLEEDEKNKGAEVFKSLNEAYRNQDLAKVSDILLKLETENNFLPPHSENIDDRAALEQKIIVLYEQIEVLDAEIKILKENNIYQRIQNIGDIDSYFSELECELQTELKALKDKEKLY